MRNIKQKLRSICTTYNQGGNAVGNDIRIVEKQEKNTEIDENKQNNTIIKYYEELKSQPDSYFGSDDTIRWM